MKFTAIILLSACLAASANGHSQSVTLTLKDAPLEKVFTEIKKQTGYTFVYKTEVLEHASKVSITVKEVSLQQVLDLCFNDQPLTYKIFQSIIAVKSKDDPTNVEENLPPPPIDVHGRVVNEKGEPVIGASVQVKGDKIKGTSTDADGYFTLKDVDENATLIISAVNIEEYIIKVNGKTDLATLNVKTKVVTGEEVKVNTGYQILKPNEVTGSVVVITKEQLAKRVAPDIISKLEGTVSGLVFNKEPITGKNQLRIRGESTLFGYTEPLIVVNNFPYDGDINDINPNDVESVTILKDAAAASIWGVRAGNGVIVITTKTGKLNQPLRVEINTNTTITQKPNLSYGGYISSRDYIDFEKYLFDQGYYSAALTALEPNLVSPVVDILNNRQLGIISAGDSANQIAALMQNDWRTDYEKYIYQRAVSQQHQISLSGGSDKASYFFSAGFDKTSSNVVGDDNSRITLNSSTTYRPLRNLELQATIGYTENQNKNNELTHVPNLFPYTRLVDNNGNPIAVPQYRAIWEDTISNHGFLNMKYIPLQERNFHDNRGSLYTTRLNTTIQYTIFNGLKASAVTIATASGEILPWYP